MSRVVIAGIGQIPVGEFWDVSLRSMATRAMLAAIKDAGGMKPQAVYIGNLLAPVISHQANLGALLTDNAGLRHTEAYTVEAAGASGAGAFRLGYMAVLSGYVDVALVVGVEKFTDWTDGQEEAVAQAADSDYEAVQGATFTSQAALLMQRYLHEFKAPRETFAEFALLAHDNAVGNPNAMFRKPIRREVYEQAELVSDPLNMFDVAPYADGAAAVLLTRSDLAPKELAHPLVAVAGSSCVTDTMALHDRPDPLNFLAAGFSVERACRQAGLMPKDVDFFELYDAFTIYSALSLEAAGFAPRGQAWKLARDGSLSLKGHLPINTLGGLKGRGNPLGATGVYQIVDACLQLRGEAGTNQLENPHRALVQALGGPASTAITHVLEKV